MLSYSDFIEYDALLQIKLQTVYKVVKISTTLNNYSSKSLEGMCIESPCECAQERQKLFHSAVEVKNSSGNL